MLTLEKVINCLEKGNIEFSKNVFTQTHEIYVAFVNNVGKKISMVFDSSNGANPIKLKNTELSNGDSVVKRFNVNDYMPNVLNVIEHRYVAGDAVMISDKYTLFSRDVLNGGKPRDTNISISGKVNGRWITEPRQVDYSRRYSPLSSSGHSNTI